MNPSLTWTTLDRYSRFTWWTAPTSGGITFTFLNALEHHCLRFEKGNDSLYNISLEPQTHWVVWDYLYQNGTSTKSGDYYELSPWHKMYLFLWILQLSLLKMSLSLMWKHIFTIFCSSVHTKTLFPPLKTELSENAHPSRYIWKCRLCVVVRPARTGKAEEHVTYDCHVMQAGTKIIKMAAKVVQALFCACL